MNALEFSLVCHLVYHHPLYHLECASQHASLVLGTIMHVCQPTFQQMQTFSLRLDVWVDVNQIKDYDLVLRMVINSAENRTLQDLSFYQVKIESSSNALLCDQGLVQHTLFT